MRIRSGVLFTVGLSLLLLGRPLVGAEQEGQADLDKAIELKLSAESPAEWGAVIDLCQSALDKGLEKENEEFCKQLLASTLLQRAEVIGGRLFDNPQDFGAQLPAAWRMAIKDVERSIEIDPKQPEAQLLLGKLQGVQGGDHKKSLKAFDEAVKLATGDDALKAQALRWRAQIREKLDDRLRDLSQAVELQPKNGEYRRLRGAINIAVGKEDDALADFDAALELDEDDVEALEGRGMALETLKRYDDARETYGRVADLLPGNPVPLLQKARISALAENYELALEDVNQALDQLSENVPQYLFALLLKAQMLVQLDKAEQAIPEARQALELQPESDDALRVWAMVTEKAGKATDAIGELRQKVEADPDHALAWLQLGLLYAAEHQPEKALDAYSAAIKINPRREFALQVRADTYLNRGMQKEAIADYEKALRIVPENSGVLNNLAWVLSTSPEAELRNGRRAIELAGKACEITNYKQAHILSTLAAAYAETGDFANARKWSAQAVELGDDSLKDQLRKELASYEKEEPWREKLSPTEEK